MLKFLKEKKARATLNFNKEIFIGELGSLIGVQILSNVAFRMGYSNEMVSFFALVGGLIGMSIFWVGTRVYHQKRQKTFSKKGFLKDAIYFTPMAAVISWGVYQPILFFLSRHLLNKGFYVNSAVFLAQLVAFLFFLIFINIFRLFLRKVSGKVL